MVKFTGNTDNDKYFSHMLTKHCKTISSEEEYDLALEMKKGGKAGEAARNKIVLANIRFAYSIAKENTGANYPLDKAKSDAMYGMYMACANYIPGESRFITFAKHYIIKAINEGRSEWVHTVHIPDNVCRAQSKYNKLAAKKYAANGITTDEDFIAEGLTISDIKGARIANMGVTSLDVTVYDDDNETTKADLLCCYADTSHNIDMEYSLKRINEVLDCFLTSIQKKVFMGRNGIGCLKKSYAELSFELGQTECSLRQQYSRAINMLQKHNMQIRALLQEDYNIAA